LSTSVDDQLKGLPGMSREDLQSLWTKLFGKPPSPALRRENLIPILAYRLQERAFGGLKAAVVKRLRQIALGESTGRRAPDIRVKPGTRIVREWQGELHEVSVLAEGYEYNGQTWRSLSEIARAITGTRWSGPAFFGIRRRSGKATTE